MTSENTDGRWRGRQPEHPPAGMVLVSRGRAAQIANVTERTITRWADRGYLTKYLDGRNRIRFSHVEVSNLGDPETEQESAPPPEPAAPQKPRW